MPRINQYLLLSLVKILRQVIDPIKLMAFYFVSTAIFRPLWNERKRATDCRSPVNAGRSAFDFGSRNVVKPEKWKPNKG